MIRDSGITIVYPFSKIASGTNSYVSNLISGLNYYEINYNKIAITKREISFMGKPYFGFVSQFLNSIFKNATTQIVHSLSPSSIIKGTNLVTIHDIIPLIKKEMYLRTRRDKFSFNLSTGKALSIPTLIVTSNVVSEQLQEHLNIEKERIKVIPLSISDRNFFPSDKPHRFQENKINVLMVSDFNPRKRVDIAIKALRNDREIEFFHIGPINSWKEKYEEAKELGKDSENIHILGQMDMEQLRNYITGADLFLFLSETEGFGLPPIEAMACGTNVIVNDIPIFHETLGEYASYVILEEFSAQTVKDVMKERKKTDVLVNHAKKFSINSHTQTLLSVYKEVIDNDNS